MRDMWANKYVTEVTKMDAPDITTVTTVAAILYTLTLPAFLLIGMLGVGSIAAVPQAWFGLYASTLILTAVKWVGTKVWKSVRETLGDLPNTQ